MRRLLGAGALASLLTSPLAASFGDHYADVEPDSGPGWRKAAAEEEARHRRDQEDRKRREAQAKADAAAKRARKAAKRLRTRP